MTDSGDVHIHGGKPCRTKDAPELWDFIPKVAPLYLVLGTSRKVK